MSEVAEMITTAQSEKIVRSQQPGELQNIQVASRLDGKNYLKWSQLVCTVLKKKWKINQLMATHVCSWLWLRIFGTQSNRRIQNLEMWLKYMRVIKTKCPEDAIVLKDFIKQDRVYDFLVRLNPEFDKVRIQILGKLEVLFFNEVVALIRGEESQRSVMLKPQTLDGSP
ncbi:hypothetical protein CK203_017712 [Vitis vinifera]|uniref:Retrotransposon Copia-like N-terminal domain-containing protein n=1 Tax=Vitis vinifera TaxID=29760 RepID=A0A438JH84_VITVI|nr:hypothetical protein CK203_017712 [Vitis vinifera]